MSDKIENNIENEVSDRLVWNQPTVTTFDVVHNTEGGFFNSNSPGDDGWYVS